MIQAIGYAAKHSFSRLKPLSFEREEAGPNDVEIAVLFCGVCHSDVHLARNELSNTVYPCMPGHEAVGRVTTIGANVTRHQVGDIVGVGCMIESCRKCEPCEAGEENYCEGPNSWLATYNGPMVPAAMAPDSANMYGRDNTYGGYSNVLVVNQDFALRIPGGLSPAVAAPILCAGVTTYSPLRHWGVKPGNKVGVIGLGGLGHMAVKLALAMGAEVTAFTTTKEKLAEATRLGATGVLESDKEAMKALASTFHFMISTVPEKHDVDPYIPMLRRDCTLCVVGSLGKQPAFTNGEVTAHRRSLSGSAIGSIAETQEVLDFCAEHGIGPDIEVIPIQDINDAYSKIEKGDVRFRYVIDMASIAQDAEA